MYKCGWNGCEKAYGTLNHLNAHVTMQSHGQKRTPEGVYAVKMPSPLLPETRLPRIAALCHHRRQNVCLPCHPARLTLASVEFKEIRKEWKARKKEEEAQRKAEEERLRQAAQQAAQQAVAQNGTSEPQTADPTQPPTTYASRGAVQLPPIAYTTSTYPPSTPAGVPQQPLPDSYSAQQLYPANYGGPTSPYGQQQHQNMYNQRKLPLSTSFCHLTDFSPSTQQPVVLVELGSHSA